MFTHQIVRITEDGRAVMRVLETGTTYVATLGFVAGNGNNLVALPDRSQVDLPALDPGEEDNANTAAELETERQRELKTREARGLSPEEASAANGEPVGMPPEPSTQAAADALREADAAQAAAAAKPGKAKAKA